MESNFDTYMRKSSCNMSECPYGYDISCADCIKRMATEHYAEHDAKVRKEAIDSCKTVVMETIDNELLVDTLLMRMDKLNENNDG